MIESTEEDEYRLYANIQGTLASVDFGIQGGLGSNPLWMDTKGQLLFLTEMFSIENNNL